MSLLLFVLAVFFFIGFPNSLTDASQYVKVGCFKDNDGPGQRALPKLLANYRGNIDWSKDDLSYIVDKCAQVAKKKNYMYFSVQFYGECWSGETAPLTYDRYGKSSQCTGYVGKSFTNMVYRHTGDEQECINYSTLNSASRSASHQLPTGSSPSCDNSLPPGWYRFLNPAGDQMASSCSSVPSGKCGTVVTGWLSTAHPKMMDGVVSGKVCFRWGSSCCQWSQDIQLRDCGRFFVYKLGKTIACPMGFCGITKSKTV
ncbi:oncoprotein-induced transcript 3 protein-like [Oculina patagonica]